MTDLKYQSNRPNRMDVREIFLDYFDFFLSLHIETTCLAIYSLLIEVLVT